MKIAYDDSSDTILQRADTSPDDKINSKRKYFKSSNNVRQQTTHFEKRNNTEGM